MKNSGLDVRFKYYWFWRDVRLPSVIKAILDTETHPIQKKLCVDRYREKYEYGYGSNWCSLTHEAVQKILEQKEWIKKTYRFTSCCDEIYKQTIIHKTGLKLYPKGNLRFIIFEPGKSSPRTYAMSDYDMLMESDKLWARKFSTQIDKQVIEKIYAELIGEGNAE